jgi:ABC-type bacteriocin/lantibiotic exporter with double-glycine peptidase domain
MLISDIFYNKIINFFGLFNYAKNEIVLFFIIFLFLIFFLKFLYSLFVKYINSNFIHDIRYSVSDNLFYRYLGNNFDFYLKNHSSNLLRNIELVNQYSAFISVLLTIIVDSLFITFSILTGIYFNFKMTSFIIFLTLVIFLIYKNIFKKKVFKITKKKLFYEAANYRQIAETFSSIKEVMVYQLKDYFYREFSVNNKNKNQLGGKLLFLQALPVIFFEFFTIVLVIGYILILFFFQKEKEEILLLVSMFSVFAVKLIPSVARVLASYQSAISYSASIKFLEKEFMKIFNNFNTPKRLIVDKFIKIKNFSLKYNNKELFTKCSLEFAKGKITSIIGSSGSGKTSIVNFLTGLIQSPKAKFYIDNKLINKKNIYLNVALVGKDNFILDDTIKNNIIFKDKYDKNKLEKVCKAVNLDVLINSLPKKLDFRTAEKGLKLSDGQKQRIFIARALYKSPSVLIFDEATNSLDKETEDNIIKSIIKLKDKTIIIFISHDIKLVKKISDKIYFINSIKKKIVKIK